MIFDPAAQLAVWQPHARCRAASTFFGRAAARRSIALCADCPCREVCFWSAMVFEEEFAARADASSDPMRYGVWGGATPTERLEIASLYGPPGGQREGMLRRRFERAFSEWSDRMAGAA